MVSNDALRFTDVTASPDLRQSAIVRRHMDLPKLLDLLHSKTLYLRRADGFADRLEGALFPTLRRQMNAAHKAGQLPHDAEHFYRRALQGNYVSCWSLGTHDNMALWQLYGGTSASVAVTSTVGRLLRLCSRWRRSAILWKVEYVDHRKVKTYVNGSYTDPLRYKHRAYTFENELRILIPQQGESWEENPPFIRLPVGKLDELVRSVVVAPEASPEFKESVADLCRRYGLSAQVRRPTLAATKT